MLLVDFRWFCVCFSWFFGCFCCVGIGKQDTHFVKFATSCNLLCKLNVILSDFLKVTFVSINMVVSSCIYDWKVANRILTNKFHKLIFLQFSFWIIFLKKIVICKKALWTWIFVEKAHQDTYNIRKDTKKMFC